MTLPQILLINVPICILLLCITYKKGNLTLRRTRAFVFIMASKRNKSAASFLSCTGYTKKICFFQEEKAYTFDFKSNIEKGSVEIQLLNSKKDILLTFESINSDILKEINLINKEKYYIIVNFYNATGVYELTWA